MAHELLYQLRMDITVTIRPGETAARYEAICPDLVGCSAVGSTKKQAIIRAMDQAAAYYAQQFVRWAPTRTGAAAD